ncbi:uncharacterized protein SCODWIG_00193 [Saccharomycodes ludwigii]|uniref:HIG1 domain-containing protein n=1 Tax=Saccharomycodes ludwigii TaxID=36035 RepID=A0A376B1B9_9ASCO|nr:hypothetical protein SCDLUD_003580 [Saccharomycodes ludwigii]KAH3900588.1 hypothetical protein SCDLUD_003580 [Saccharomycodes ludwigii]SSD58432.1 uncharacterized protein SCODWIG_00193 [Saccharomycodes ludwigii]
MGVLPVHYDKATIKELTKELSIGGIQGAIYGAMISISTGFLLKRFSTVYRNVRAQVRVFYHCAWISMGSVFVADKQLIKFQEKYYENEYHRRQQALDIAADKGLYLDDQDVVKSTTTEGVHYD